MASSFNVVKNKANRIPAVVHVDGTLRPQFVSKETNPKYHKLINEFFKITSVPILLNTSFNVKGEPIVCNPTDAIRCFYSSGLDALVIGDFLIKKITSILILNYSLESYFNGYSFTINLMEKALRNKKTY